MTHDIAATYSGGIYAYIVLEEERRDELETWKERAVSLWS